MKKALISMTNIIKYVIYCITALIWTSLLSTPALSRDWPEAAGWTIFEGENYCGMRLQYEGRGQTEFFVVRNLDATVQLLVANDRWSAKIDEQYDINFYLDNKTYGGAKSHGVKVGYRPGFATKVTPEFWRDFKAAKSLRIGLGSTLIDHLSLAGTSAAGDVVERCLEHVRGLNTVTERQRERLTHIPDDPFTFIAKQSSPPRLPTSAETWITQDDYPIAALRAREEGLVTVRLDITSEGRISNCTLISSSGSSSLDEATCATLRRRGRLTAAIDNGRPVGGTLEHQVRWRLPKTE